MGGRPHDIPPTQVHGLFQVFQEEKKSEIKRQGKLFLINEVDRIVRIRASGIEFSLGDKHAKIICVGPAGGEEGKHASEHARVRRSGSV